MANVDAYLKLNKGETLATSTLLEKIRIRDIPWLVPTATPLNSAHSNTKESTDGFACLVHKQQALQALLYWIFASFINPLLAASFYITEVEGRGLQTLYYRRADWETIEALGKEQLRASFQPIVATPLQGSSRLQPATLRRNKRYLTTYMHFIN